MKTVYTCFTTDVIHEGHLNIIRAANQYGRVIAGVLTDAAMLRYNQFPTKTFEERMQLLQQTPGIAEVVRTERYPL